MRIQSVFPRHLAAALFLLGLAFRLHAEDGGPNAPVAATPQQKMLDQLRVLVQREPRHVGAMYVAARVSAGVGDAVQASDWLDRLEKVGLGDELDADDFGDYAKTPAFLARAARFAKAAPPIGKASQWAESSCADLLRRARRGMPNATNCWCPAGASGRCSPSTQTGRVGV